MTRGAKIKIEKDVLSWAEALRRNRHEWFWCGERR